MSPKKGRKNVAARAKLRVADERHLEELSEVEAFAESLSDEFLQCREMNHRWLPHTVGRYRDGGFQRVLRCPRCKCRKIQELTSRGMVMGTRYVHPEGYLHKGMGQIVGEGRGVLRLASIMRSPNIKELDQD
jgi:hypothetical protein